MQYLHYLRAFIQMRRNYVEAMKISKNEITQIQLEGKIEAYNEILNEIDFQIKLQTGEE